DLLQQSHSQKLFANTLFSSAHYSDAISKYEQALSLCPNYLDFEIAILKSNIAACFIKLEDWKAAVDSATEALDGLERTRLLPPSSSSSSSFKGKEREEKKKGRNDDDGKIVEITAEDGGGEQEEEEALAALRKRDEKKADVQRIHAKALLRRARAKSELGGWANLQAAHEGNFVQADYILLTKSPSVLPIPDQKTIQRALSSLPARISEAKEKEMGEMLGKLKDLGNGLLKPFGLSTDMFKMQQDPETGGYNLQVNQGG
ncbi:hypothetical protein MMC31_007925, partial [Peltigera leucophlebia]|nr:hypothetical protein [Peltigera leucophlebia]